MTLFASVLVSPTWAAIINDDFEDGNLDGWTSSSSGGTATFDVVLRNGSLRAHLRHVSNTATRDHSALSRTVDYTATDWVSFDMEALAFLGQDGARRVDGLAGVEVSFLDAWNVPLGWAGLFNVTSTSLLGANDSAIGDTQQHFSATMAQYAALAGLGESAPIAKMSISFLADGDYSPGSMGVPTLRSGGDVWFDNFSVVPEPASLLLLALGGLAVHRRRR